MILPTVLKADNATGMRWLLREVGPKFALVYADPPFFTQRTHEIDGRLAFDDRWSTLEDFVADLSYRMKLAQALLRPGGSFVLHLNWRASHYAKVEGDRVFGYDAFASEIVWHYRRWPTKTPNFQRNHDVLLRWTKPGAEPTWNQLYEPLAESTRKKWGTRKQHHEWSTRDGKAVRNVTQGDETPGAPLGDVWSIGIIAPNANERTGYPTQKPYELLARLILATTNEGDFVLDPYAGSGTTLEAAGRLGRPSYGIDQSEEAIQVMEKRLGLKGRISV